MRALATLVLVAYACSLHAEPWGKFRQPVVGGGPVASGQHLEEVVAYGLCSGVLVNPTLLLTSAHCIRTNTAGNVRTIEIGDDRLVPTQSVAVKSCRVSPQYQNQDAGDIGYCILAQAVTTPFASINSTGGHAAVGGAVDICGFGGTSADTTSGHQKYCATAALNSLPNHVGLFSLGNARQTACYGDSGGPAFDQAHALLGLSVAPAAIPCAGPTTYIAVAPYLSWIQASSQQRIANTGAALKATGAVAKAAGRRQVSAGALACWAAFIACAVFALAILLGRMRKRPVAATPARRRG